MSMNEIFNEVMQKDSLYYEPRNSPWGEIQTYQFLTKGAFFVNTASHGGVLVVKDLSDCLLSKEAQLYAFPFCGYLCYEEDCDAPIAIRELLDKKFIKAPVNQYYKAGEYEAAINDSLQQWHPEYWQAREQRLQKEQKVKQRKLRNRETR